MSSRARSTSSTTSVDDGGQADPPVRVRGVDDEIARRGSRTRFAHQRRGVRELSRIRPSGSRRYQTTAWRGDPSSSVVATEATCGPSRKARMASDRTGVVADIGPWYVGGRAARAGAGRRRRRWLRPPPRRYDLGHAVDARHAQRAPGDVVRVRVPVRGRLPAVRDRRADAVPPRRPPPVRGRGRAARLRARGRADGRRLVGRRGRTPPRPPAGGHRRRGARGRAAASRSCSAASSRSRWPARSRSASGRA